MLMHCRDLFEGFFGTIELPLGASSSSKRYPQMTHDLRTNAFSYWERHINYGQPWESIWASEASEVLQRGGCRFSSSRLVLLFQQINITLEFDVTSLFQEQANIKNTFGKFSFYSSDQN